MTDSSKTLIAVLLDRSGSMSLIESAVRQGFDAFIREQRGSKGSCRVTLAQFDSEYEVVYANKDVADVPPLVLEPRWNTALRDSMARLITDTGAELNALPEGQRPGNVIVAVMTDGKDNASREWSPAAIKHLVEQQTTKYGWQILYMGANQDAVESGTSLGIQADNSITFAVGNAQAMMAQTSQNVSAYRSLRASGAENPSDALKYTAGQRNAVR